MARARVRVRVRVRARVRGRVRIRGSESRLGAAGTREERRALGWLLTTPTTEEGRPPKAAQHLG